MSKEHKWIADKSFGENDSMVGQNVLSENSEKYETILMEYRS